MTDRSASLSGQIFDHLILTTLKPRSGQLRWGGLSLSIDRLLFSSAGLAPILLTTYMDTIVRRPTWAGHFLGKKSRRFNCLTGGVRVSTRDVVARNPSASGHGNPPKPRSTPLVQLSAQLNRQLR